MKQCLPILILVCSAWIQAVGQPRIGPFQAIDAASASQSTTEVSKSTPAISPDQENARKARAAIDRAIQALGGQAYLTIRDIEQQGRLYSFHHGRENGGGVFWSF